MEEALFERIKAVKMTLPKKQAGICDYICEHPVEVTTMTAAELAAQLGVGTATITRLVNSLGFSNFSNFKREMRKVAMSDAKNLMQNTGMLAGSCLAHRKMKIIMYMKRR